MKNFVLVLAASVSVTQAAPLHNGTHSLCTHKSQRKAWHTLTDSDKHAYLTAEKCLMSSPAILSLPTNASRSRFDELQQSHAMSTNTIHHVGAFFPYHRFLVHTHEQLLKTVCGYTGAQPYWDEALDAGNFAASPLLDPETGFGGDGKGEGQCIHDGPFKGYVNPIGPGERVGDHCINRNLGDCISVYGAKLAGRQYVDACAELESYAEWWPCIEFGPHSAGHVGIGGENLASSPGDPLFYLHHAYIDKLWWEWQSKNLSARSTDISGPIIPQSAGLPTPFLPGGPAPLPAFPDPTVCPGFPGSPPPPPDVLPWPVRGTSGDPGNVTTLDHVLTVDGALSDVRIRDVMSVESGMLCYEYV